MKLSSMPRGNLWPHLNSHERALMVDWWVELERSGLLVIENCKTDGCF